MQDQISPALPAPISAYLEANARLDAEAMLAPFASDAVVGDERRSHAGTDEIRAWILEASIANQAVPRVTGYRLEDGGQARPDVHVVDAEVSGGFPGSPVQLSFRFVLADGAIARLAIS
ncbi:hypothetical protein DFR52_101153 [Hoeflea marina]|uniref:SnoaL-like protein n=1 Tax=Hoeflea marina TaxID=274592 RepID=A0A317PPS7_9HYPH|nr:nuclear transport factor 2 family protein [Hoeflea marina]PWW03472.1 hypothetical protein DFR52_101153 [Hoeflea marina]